MNNAGEKIGRYIASLILEEEQYSIGVFPGAFKPPHKGHYDIVRRLLDQCDEVVVLISPKPRDGVTADESVAVWELYKQQLNGNVTVMVASLNPVKETYEIITNNPEAKVICAFGKGDIDRFEHITKNIKYKNAQIFDAGNLDSLSATQLRIALKSGNDEEISKFIPEGITAEDFKNALGIKSDLSNEPSIEQPAEEQPKEENPIKQPTEPLKESLKEGNDRVIFIKIINELVNYCCNELGISRPKIKIINNKKYTEENKSYGGYLPSSNEIYVVVHDRTLADCMRTLSHEIYHSYQNSNNQLTPESGKDGDPIENEANSYSGKVMRIFGKKNPEIFFMKYSS
jgi:cytidyltransferase-like protein